MTLGELRAATAHLPADTPVVVRDIEPGSLSWYGPEAKTSKMYRTVFGDYSQFRGENNQHRNDVLVIQIS